jgi:hypothetical protein
MTASASVVVVEPSGRPILLVGPPRGVAGEITLVNPGETTLVLRDFGVADRSGRLVHLPARQRLTMPAVLRPGQQQQLRIEIALVATTHPGEYHVAIEITGQERDAVLHVTEDVALRVEPATLFVTNEPERPQMKRIAVSNEGNVAATLGDIRDVALRDDLEPAIDVRLALQALASQPHLVVDALRRDGPTMGRLSLGIAGGPATIAPGETRTIEVAVTLPEPPPPNGRYRARVPLLNATLNIIVTPSGATHEPSYEKHARNTRAASTPARRKGRGRS